MTFKELKSLSKPSNAAHFRRVLEPNLKQVLNAF